MTERPYHESLRPRFHFTAKNGWLNDPNGLVFYQGEYHLFFQHNPLGNDWGNMTWGHATSRDLLHWEQLPNAICPDAMGTIFSGSAAVDWQNTAGFQAGPEKVIVAAYTAAGATSALFCQCLAYSNDCGRTWQKYSGNPVLPNITGHADRDPKIFWHAATGQWVMVLCLRHPQSFGFFTSPDLKTWKQASTLTDFFECPDLIELAVEGDPGNKKWVLLEASGQYLIGRFDGQSFQAETEKQSLDFGKFFYAPQTFNDIPAGDGRKIQLAWMRGGKYPDMPFNQQMAFPCELTLQSSGAGLHLRRRPVREIEALRGRAVRLQDLELKPGSLPVAELPGCPLDIAVTFAIGAAAEVGLDVGGEAIRYNVRDAVLSCMGGSAPLLPESGRIRLRVLADRTSIEVFGNDGRVVLSSCFLPAAADAGVSLFAAGGPARVTSFEAYVLNGIWP